MDVCFSFGRMAMRKLIYPRGKIFGIVDIHFGERNTFSQKGIMRKQDIKSVMRSSSKGIKIWVTDFDEEVEEKFNGFWENNKEKK